MKALGKLKRLLFEAPIRKCTALKLFDQLIRPIVTYGCEIWGTVNMHSSACRQGGQPILETLFAKLPQERLNVSFAKYLLGVSSNTSNIAVMGELGRYPLYLFIINQLKNYYHRLENLNDDSLVKLAYDEQKTLNQSNKNSWLNQTQDMLDYYDLKDSSVANCPRSQNRKTMKHLQNRYKQYWNTDIDNLIQNNSSKLDMYREIKQDFYYEPYLDMVGDRTHQVALTRLRLSNHRLHIEMGRYARPKLQRALRVCILCNSGEVEDESHFLLHCSQYSEERNNMIYKLTPTDISPLNTKHILSEYTKNSIQSVAHYIHSAFKKRQNYMEQKST